MALTADTWIEAALADVSGRLVPDDPGDDDAFTKAVYTGLRQWSKGEWAMAGAKPGAAAPYVRQLYMELGLLKKLRAKFYRFTDVRLGRFGPSSSQSQIFKNLSQAVKDLWAELQEARKDAALSGAAASGAGGPSAGVLTRTAPWEPRDGTPDGTDGSGNVDPGSPVYGGWPLPGGRWGAG